MKHLILLTSLLFSLTFFAQTQVKKELKAIENIEDAENYLAEKKSKKNKLIAFNEEKHKTKLAKTLLKLPIGAKKVVKKEFAKTHYKVISKTNTPHYRVSYIYLDANTISLERITEIKRKVFSDFEDGAPFHDLAKKYSMAKNAPLGGDSGWIKKGEMPIEIEEPSTSLDYKVNDMFTVRIPESNAFYIILKTHYLKKIKESKVLKVIERK